ncbi:MAG: AbrB/MazE/SpoVT family DNA-binding domain-containing protein [Halobacteriota archaeon]|jgi:bifunctional DNA-binding transcriptional regulator/antitoxin component of YhaV-PrlF toxin-antitoxin module
MTRIVRQLRGGQVTIPADYRRMLGITDDSLLQMSAEAGELRIKPIRVTGQAGSGWINELYELFVPVRKQASQRSEQEVNAAIDEAVQAVRKAHG